MCSSDLGAHFYDVYECKDGKYVSLGSIEPQFYAELLEKSGLGADPDFAKQMDQSMWPGLKEKVRACFLTKTRAEWCAIMEASDVCFAPVLTMSEAAAHPHHVARQTFTTVAGVQQPAPAPRLSRTAGHVARPPAHPGQHTTAVLADWGIPTDRIEALLASGVAKQA